MSVLPSPFKEAFEHGASIQYKCSGKDHDYVRKLGYEPRMAGDCVYFVDGLDGLSLSTYGDNGTFHSRFSNEKSRNIFLDMVAGGIVKLYGFTTYLKDNGVLRTYIYQDGVCKKFSNDGIWVECEIPYSNGED